MDRLASPAGEMRQLFVEYADTGDRAIRDQLIEANLGLARVLARRFANRGENLDDLVQVASVALVYAIDRFDPTRGVEFSTFATRTVIGELKRHFRDKGWSIRAPRRIQELYLELSQIIEVLSQRLGRPPTVAEMARATGETEEAVLEALEAGRSYRTSSIDAPDRQQGTLADRLGDSDPRFEGTDDRIVLERSLTRLSERDRRILYLRFVRGLTQSEIAELIGVSQMHVSRLISSSLATLREIFFSEE